MLQSVPAAHELASQLRSAETGEATNQQNIDLPFGVQFSFQVPKQTNKVQRLFVPGILKATTLH
jgi:hypothetical protein